MAISGQLWYGAQGYPPGTNPPPSDATHGDNRIGYVNSDGTSGVETFNSNSNVFYSAQLDTANNLYFALTRSGNSTFLVVGNIATGTPIGSIQIGADASHAPSGIDDEISSIAVDYINHKVYFDVWGSDASSTGIFAVSYNANAASTGTANLASGYNGTTGTAITGSPLVLLTENSAANYINGGAFWIDAPASQLYFVDDSFGYPGYTTQSQTPTNGIYVVSTAGQNQVPTLIAGLPTSLPGGGKLTISSLTVDKAKGLIYFATNERASNDQILAGTTNDALYYVPIGGGTPTKMTLPAGITLAFPLGNSSGDIIHNALALDANTQTLYVSDLGNAFAGGSQGSHIVQLVLNGPGTGFISGQNNFYTVDSNYPAQSTALGVTFAGLPTLTVTAATGQALQGSAAYKTLGAATALTDADSNIASATIKIANSAGAAVAGDQLYVSAGGTNTQSGSITIGGASFTVGYNTSTDTLTLSGSATATQYAAALADVTYRDTGNDTTTSGHAVRTLTWTAYDGEAGNPVNLSFNQKITTVTLDRAPVTATHTANVIEGASTIGVSLSDTDPDGDPLTVVALVGGSVGTAKAGLYGSLTLNSNDTYGYSATNHAALNSAATGSHPIDSFSYTVSDGFGGTATETLNITLDRAPLLSLGGSGSLAYTPGGTAVQIAAAGTLSDPDGDAIFGLTVTVTGGYSGDGDRFRAGSASSAVLASNGTVTVSATSFAYTYNTATETLTFNGAHTAAQYQALLQSLYFDSAAADPTSGGANPGRNLAISATDTFGGSIVQTETVTLSPAAPSITTLVNHTGTGPASYTDHNLVELSGTAPANAIVTLYNGATAIGSGTASSGGTFDITASTSLADGSYSLTAKAAVGGSTSAASAAFGVTVDATAPAAAITSQTLAVDTGASATDRITSNGQVSLSGTASDGGTGLAGVHVFNGATDLGAATLSGANWSFSTVLGGGTYNLSAKATDLAGNITATAAQAAIVVDTTAPTFGAVTTSTTGAVHAGATVTFAVAASEAVLASGTPNLTLSNGGVAHYAGGSGTNTLTFTYGVAGGQYTTDLHVTGLALNGGTLTDVAGNALAGGVANTDTALSVDTTPPTLAVTPAGTAAIEGGAAGPLLATDAITDTDGGGTLTGATVQITGAVAGDRLLLPGISGATGTLDGGAITVSGNGTGSLTLAGADSLATYQTLLGQVQYQDAGTDTTTDGHATRTIVLTVSNANLTSANATTTLVLDRAPIVPGLSAGVVAGATISADAAHGLLAGATDGDGDPLTVTAVNGQAASVGQALAEPDGTLTINADGSYSFVANAGSTAAAGAHPSLTVPFTVSDGYGAAVTADLVVTLDRLPTAATATGLASASATLTVAAAGGVLAGDSDSDGDALAVSAVGGGSVGGAVAGTYGDLTLNADGSYSYMPGASPAEQAALAGHAGRPLDSFDLTISDGHGGTAAQTLAITVDRAPVLAAGAAPGTYTEGAPALAVLPGATVSDPDGDALASASVSIAAGLLPGDVLAANTAGTAIAASYDAATGVLTLTGSASAAEYQQVLDSVTFSAIAENAATYGAPASRTLSVQVSDGSFPSALVTQPLALAITFADTAAHVAADFDALNTDPHLSAITITDGQALLLGAAQFTGDTTALARITGAHEILATGFSGTGYASIDEVFGSDGVLIDATYGGVTGQPYTSYTQVFASDGHLTNETFNGYTGQTYVSLAVSFDSAGHVTAQQYYDASGNPAAGQPTVSLTYNADGSTSETSTLHDAQGNPTQSVNNLQHADGTSILTYSGVTGEAYTGYSFSYDAAHTLTGETISGYDVATYGYASVTATFDSQGQVTSQSFADGSGHVVQAVSLSYGAGGAHTITTTDYDSGGGVSLTIVDAENADGSAMVSYSNVPGQPYTGYSQSYDASHALTSETIEGYSEATYGFVSVTDSFNSAGQVSAQSFHNASGVTVQTVALSYGTGGALTLTTNLYDNQGALTQTVLDAQNADGSGTVTYSNITGQPYTGYSQHYDTTNTLVAEQVFNTNGSETDYAFGQNQTIASHPANQIEYAIGGNDTFEVGPNFGHDQMVNYTGGNDSFAIASSLFANFTSLMAAATDDGHGSTLITYDANDTFLIAGMTPTQLQQHAADFHFV